VSIQPAIVALSAEDSPPAQGPQRVTHAGPSARVGEPFSTEVARAYQEGFAALFRYLDRLTGDPQLAADVAQEAFVRLLQRGEMPDQPGAWLVTVATNLLRDDRRQLGRRLRLLEADPDSVPVATPAPDPATAADTDERRRLVRAALERLTPRDRSALLLRHSGYSYREIASAVGIAEASVGTVLLRAGAAFRSVYEEMHGAPD
jgi:RNA polymerase sigma factor (sigma-70 family)